MIQTSVFIGIVFSLCAMISGAVSGTRKKHSEIMAVQIVSQFFCGASSIALKGYSGTAWCSTDRNRLEMLGFKAIFVISRKVEVYPVIPY